MDSSKIKKDVIEGAILVIGGALAFMLKGKIPVSGYIEAVVGFVIVFVGAYIDGAFVGSFLEGFGIVLAVDGLSASLPSV